MAATKRVRMLTTATGPYLHCEAGRAYDLPAAIADDFLAVKEVKTVDKVIVNGKETVSERVIGTVGPFAILAPTAKTVTRNFKRNPNDGEKETDSDE